MRTLSIILLSSLILLFSREIQTSNAQDATLEIRITNIKSLNGNLMVAVFDAESKFLKDYSVAKRKKVSAKEHVIVFENLPQGIYAVSIFHDVNSNSKLDSNFFGIPKEPYGFSNNPSSLFGPPSYEKAAFIINESKKTIIVEL